MTGSSIPLRIEKLVYGGHGLARDNGRVLLTPFVLPGERIIAEPVDKLHARLIRIDEPSPERVPAPCPYYGVCGGCHYQHAPYEFQLTQKREILREVFRRIGKINAPADIRIVRGPEWQYRNRTQLHVQDRQIGYLRMGSHELCPVDHCPISSPKLNEAIAALAEMVRHRRWPPFIRSVELFTNETDVQFNVIATDKPLARHFFDWAAEQIPGHAAGAIPYHAAGETFNVGPRSFFQVNRFLVDALVETAIGDATGDTAVDLYAGVGLFTIPLTKRFRSVTAVERGPGLVATPGVQSVKSAVDEYVRSLDSAPDFVLTDPPRDGLGKIVTRELLRISPKRLHIVSCDPATLARDLRHLLDGGYAIDLMTLVDLFPQTYHLETVVHLSRG